MLYRDLVYYADLRSKCNELFTFFFSPATQSGSHWFVLFKNFDAYEVFDSLGTSSSFIKAHLKALKGKVFFNSSSVQASHTDTCGQFACYFAILRLLNLDLTFVEVGTNMFV